MKDMFLKFNVYDQIAYVFVGSVALTIIYFDFVVFDLNFPVFNLTTLPLWIVIGYFMGHLIQAIANLVVKEKRDDFSDQERKILDSAKKHFKAAHMQDGEIWNLCYMFANAKDITGQIQSFNAYYSLYRGWFIVFAMESLFLIGYTISTFTIGRLSLVILCLLITILFFRRMRRFFNYLKDKVLQTFIILTISEK